MKLLLIVGSANDIFIYNYAKWLKATMDVCIDVFEFYPSKQQGFSNEYYDCVYSAKSCGIPKIRVFLDPLIKGKELTGFIRNRQYDIIHCHWVVPPLVLSKGLKKHCQKLVVTFWGREYANMSLLGSNTLFRNRLYSFFSSVDALINSSESEQLLRREVYSFKGIFYNASLGSSPLEALYSLMDEESKEESKKALSIPIDKNSVLIGYSGKTLHQHLAIISELAKHDDYKKELHLLAPMTRGCSADYVEKVRSALEQSGYSFTQISGRFLSDKEIAQIRNATDITLQLSLSDGFSRSIVECLCAKSIVLYGDWLEYSKYLEPAGFQGVCVKSIQEGVDMISSILRNKTDYQKMLLTNFESGKKEFMWSECIQNWVNAYNDLLK